MVLPVMISSAPMWSCAEAGSAAQSAMTAPAGSVAGSVGLGSPEQPSQIALEAMSVNVLPRTRLSSLPYLMPRPMPPRSVKVSPRKVVLSAAVSDTLASGWLNAPHGHVPGGPAANAHSPWLLAPVTLRLACTWAKPTGVEGCSQVAVVKVRPVKLRPRTGFARVPVTCTSDSSRGTSTSRFAICWPAGGS